MQSNLTIYRFPPTSDKSLRAWSTADTHILNLVKPLISVDATISIMNDRFGYLTMHLHEYQPHSITHYKSQEDALFHNLKLNKLDPEKIKLSVVLDSSDLKSDFVVMKVPKSMDLFHLLIQKAHRISKSGTKVFCGFMTRHFTKQMVEIASQYFEQTDQSLAWKKSRVLQLSRPKPINTYIPTLKTIYFNNHRGENLKFDQYYGVFSANHIDYATEYLLDNIKVEASLEKMLDLASGNGVIAHELRVQCPHGELHLMDDSHLAIESSKLNLSSNNTFFHYTHHLDHFQDDYFDLVVSNPPFHFEHENTIEIALNLFKGVRRILKSKGEFVLVANKHLNYKTHLRKLFSYVTTEHMNSKFEIISCKK